MTLEFCFLLNVILLSRLSFTFLDKAVNRKRMVIMVVLQIFGLLFYEFTYLLVYFALALILINLVLFKLEKHSRNINRFRLLSLILQVVLLSLFFSARVDITFNLKLIDFLISIKDYSLLLAGIVDTDWTKVNLLMLGFLLVINEANILIRYLMQSWRLLPKEKGKKKNKDGKDFDIKEFNTGRIIGILERIIIYYFVLISQYAAIGLILTAKGISLRSREIGKLGFAEYALVGTLLSALAAMIIAGVIQLLMT
jgi:hypothetical protein